MAAIPAAALENHIAILGKTGSGKSNTAKTIAEQLMSDGARVCVIDPTGTWWGIRLMDDGKCESAFKPVIFGGNHADIAIGGGHGIAIAEAVATSSDSAIIDTRTLTVGERTRFFTGFAETLLRKNQGPLHLIIDEAHLFAPQTKVNSVESGVMLHAANNLVSLGRGIGLRIILISQRPAKLHKDSLSQVETLVAMRLIVPQDRKAIREWIADCADPDTGATILSSLPSMATGAAWVWSPQIDFLEHMAFPLACTYDTGRVRGEAAAIHLPPIDVAAISAKLDEIDTTVRANDPAALKKRIAELEKAAAAGSTERKSERDADWSAGYACGRSDGYLKGREAGWKKAIATVERRMADAFHDAWDTPLPELTPEESEHAGVTLGDMRTAHKAATGEDPPPDTRRFSKPPPYIVSGDPKALEKALETEIAGAVISRKPLTPAKQRILVALRQLDALGHKIPERMNVAWLAGASPKSSSFANNLGALRTAGLIDYPQQNRVALTGAGMAMVPEVSIPTHADIMALVRGLLTPAMYRILEQAVEHYPNNVSFDEVAEAVGASPTSSAFANNRGRLRSLGLIEYPQSGDICASPMLFP